MVTTIHKPVLIVIAGPNGSGKTTITTQILQHEWMENAVYINPDQIAKDKFGDWNSREAIMESVKYCEGLREECLREQKSLIFETVLSADDKLDYIESCPRCGILYPHILRCNQSSLHQRIAHCSTCDERWSRCAYYQGYFPLLQVHPQLPQGKRDSRQNIHLR